METAALPRSATAHAADTFAGTAPASLPAPHASLVSILGWEHTATLTFPARAAAFAESAEIPALATPAATLLATGGPLYRHQALALAHCAAGRSTVLATGTGSGKTRVFHLSAAQLLAEQSRGLVLALYPGKALAREQSAKWHAALVQAGLATAGDRGVALLTGDTASSARASALSAARVAVLTPDILHAWLLARLADRAVRQALARVRLIVLDEAHTLAGVFGSNTLLLFRRLQHALHALGAPAPRWLAASATLAQPAAHLATLVGHPFVAVTEADDTSPRHLRHLHFIRPSDAVGLSAGLQRWLQVVAAGPARFIAFTQSRKQTELLSVLANRHPASSEDDDAAALVAASPLVAPYRSGLDPAERADLQDRFAAGTLRGLVCTSAFELGIDLPGLDLGFLVGLPGSPASFWQRLGRFGRHGEAHIFLLDDGTAGTAAAFAAPGSLPSWVARDAALYPDNPILLARHALCLAHEVSALSLGDRPLGASPALTAPLRALFTALQRGEPTAELRDAQSAQGNTQPPHLAFPLRACEDTYTFKGAQGGPAPAGSITHGQLLREAYPGAVYYHGGQAWRIQRIQHREHTAVVSRERGYHTQPKTIPAHLVPDLSRPTLSDLAWPASGLRLLEACARATESVTGFTELQGSRRSDHDYATQPAYGQSGPLFRGYETTAMLLCHPLLDDASPGTLRHLGALLREALLHCCPREAAELAATPGIFRADRRELAAGRRFIAIYDTVPGSLRLCSALAETSVLRATLELTADLARQRYAESADLDLRATVALASALQLAELASSARAHPLDWPETSPALAYAPGTTALHRKRQLAVTIVRAFTDLDGALHYEIRRTDDPAFHGTVAAEALVEIPDVTRVVPLSTALAE